MYFLPYRDQESFSPNYNDFVEKISEYDQVMAQSQTRPNIINCFHAQLNYAWNSTAQNK